MNAPAPVRLYLDIDGVLNCYDTRAGSHERQWPPEGPWPDYKTAPLTVTDGRELPLCWSPTLMRTVGTLEALPGVEVVHVTSWEQEAWRFDDFVLLPRLRWLPLRSRPDGTRGPVEESKLTPVLDDVAANPVERWAWVDDDIWTPGLLGDGGLAVRPSPEAGITPGILTQIVDHLLPPADRVARAAFGERREAAGLVEAVAADADSRITQRLRGLRQDVSDEAVTTAADALRQDLEAAAELIEEGP